MRNIIYHVAKQIGSFAVSRRLLRKRLLILCYHGFEVGDESSFMPGVFMKAATFARRMAMLDRLGYKVIPLQDAIAGLMDDSLPDNAVCITIDDGFFSTAAIAAPILNELSYPSTLYATTYYIEKGTPIFNLVVQYMVWKGRNSSIMIDGYEWGLDGTFDLGNVASAQALCSALIAHGDSGSVADRQSICRRLGATVGVDYEQIERDRRFSLMNAAELAAVERLGMDVQLHTHRHRLPSTDEDAAKREVLENAAVLGRMLGKTCVHLCYPSGEWAPNQIPWLIDAGVVSATTCDTGMSRPGDPLLALYRFVDRQDLPLIKFEAELAGFGEMLRIVSGRKRAGDSIRRRAVVVPRRGESGGMKRSVGCLVD